MGSLRRLNTCGRPLAGAIAAVATWCVLAAPAPVGAQTPPPLDLNLEPRTRNALVGSSGLEWDGGRGIGRFSGIEYEREVLSRFLLRLNFGQSYNGDGDVTINEFISSGVPVRQTDVTDFSRLLLGAQVAYVQPIGGVRAIVLAGPAWTRVSRTEHRILTDLRFGDSRVTRRSISDSSTGLLVGGGIELDIADNFAWRALVLHNAAGVRNTTTLALGGVMKF